MSSSGRYDRADVSDLRAAVRYTGPSHRVAEVTGLVPDAVLGAGDELLEGVERMTGLRPGELAVLLAVAEGGEHSRRIARDVGQADAAAEATIAVLVRRGLLARHAHERASAEAPPALVHLTESGRVALEQVEALRIRLLDAVVDTLGEDTVERVRRAVSVVQDAMTAIPDSHRTLR